MRALTTFTVVLAVVLGLSFGAQATTLSITADQANYLVSDTITLTVIGDPGTGVHQKSFGTIEYDGLLVTALGGQTQTTLKNGGGTGWIVGGLLIDLPNADTQDSFNQIFGGTVAQDSTKKLTAVMTFHADASGTANFDWRTVGAQAFSFFGLTNAPGVTVTIGTPVPEPSTAGLMGLGLIGLVIAGRSRKS
jgi:hypothetical protein